MAQKVLRVAVLGVPNVGKSTIVNAILGRKISIVSPKVQTTRQNTKGIWTHDNVQTVFFDTPGIVPFQEGRKLRLSRSLLVDSRNAALEADIALNVVDDRQLYQEFDETKVQPLKVLSKQDDILNEIKSKQVLVINKIDTIKHPEVIDRFLDKVQESNYKFAHIFKLSATQGTGLEPLKTWLLNQAQPGEWEYNSNELTDQTMDQMVKECIREQLFYHLEQELPYSLQQRVIDWKVEENCLNIQAEIIVKSANQRAIVIGKKGRIIRLIAVHAEEQLKAMLQRDVKLGCGVVTVQGNDKVRLFS